MPALIDRFNLYAPKLNWVCRLTIPKLITKENVWAEHLIF